MPRFAPLCALKVKKIADAGLIIAALDERDAHHDWAAGLLGRESPPWLVCEPVLEMLRVADLELAFDLDENRAEVLALVRKYRDQEIDLADACVVRMSELYEDSVVYTVDRKDFIVYRRHGRRPVRCSFPG